MIFALHLLNKCRSGQEDLTNINKILYKKKKKKKKKSVAYKVADLLQSHVLVELFRWHLAAERQSTALPNLTRPPAQDVIPAEVCEGHFVVSRPWLVLAQALWRSAVHYKWPLDWRTPGLPRWMRGKLWSRQSGARFKAQRVLRKKGGPSWKAESLQHFSVCDRRRVCGQICFSGLEVLVQLTEADSGENKAH